MPQTLVDVRQKVAIPFLMAEQSASLAGSNYNDLFVSAFESLQHRDILINNVQEIFFLDRRIVLEVTRRLSIECKGAPTSLLLDL
jgi:hypothetical protein